MTKGREFCKSIKTEIKQKHLERTAADDSEMIERVKQGMKWQGAEGEMGLYQWFKQSRQTASSRTAGSEQRAAKADKRLIQAWRAPLITRTHKLEQRMHKHCPHDITLIHRAKYTHLNSPLDTQPQSGNKEEKIVSVDSFYTKRAERQKSLIHVGLNTETRTFQTICWPMPSPGPCVYNYYSPETLMTFMVGSEKV